jgi:predicted HTH domain antitoxin
MSILIQADFPEDIRSALLAAGYSPQKLGQEALRYYAGVLYARKALSLEQAARLAGMSLWDYIPFLSEQGIAVADYDEEEVATELETAEWLASTLKR